VGIGYQPPSYVLKAPKMKSIPRPLLVPSQGVSNERGGNLANGKYSLMQNENGNNL